MSASLHPFKRSKVPGEDQACLCQDVVQELHKALTDVEGGLKQAPAFLKTAFREQVWRRERILTGGMPQPPVTFWEFVHEPYPVGLGRIYADVREILLKTSDNDALNLWDQAVANDSRQGERTDLVDNGNEVREGRPTGNTAQYALRKLRKAADAGDDKAAGVLARVVSDDLSPNAAAIEMGWRKKTITVVDSPDALFAAAIKAIQRQVIDGWLNHDEADRKWEPILAEMRAEEGINLDQRRAWLKRLKYMVKEGLSAEILHRGKQRLAGERAQP